MRQMILQMKQIRLREFPIVHSEVPATLTRARFTAYARDAQQYPQVQNHAHPHRPTVSPLGCYLIGPFKTPNFCSGL